MTTNNSSPVWHPFTQHALHGPMLPIASAKGAWLTSKDGKRIFDAISSWWVTTHGHCHPKITKAIQRQAETIDQVIFAGLTHEPAQSVAETLVEITPETLNHVFFSDSGSTCVEVAMKMALGYWRNIGRPRTRILALEHGYHGDTIGTMSAGARGVFNAAYEPLLFDVTHLPFPQHGAEQNTLDALESACRAEPIAALLIEPIILGAGGMKTYRACVLSEMKRVCEAYGVLFIADEVMTGWGRTGTLFACEQASISPDILCLAKGLTGGSLPLAATLCTPEIYEAHFSTDRTKTFFHSSSFTANPIACAAAKANLEIWKTEPVLERIGALASIQAEQLKSLSHNKRFENPRQAGTITAIDVKVDDDGYLSKVGPKLYETFLELGILLRPLGNTIYVMPPYCTTPEELATVYQTISDTLESGA